MTKLLFIFMLLLHTVAVAQPPRQIKAQIQSARLVNTVLPGIGGNTYYFTVLEDQEGSTHLMLLARCIKAGESVVIVQDALPYVIYNEERAYDYLQNYKDKVKDL